jgi:hypothetical protein
MKILTAIHSGFERSLKSWKGILIVWFLSLILVSLIAIPMKGALKTGLGNSMITEKLSGGINVEVFADLGASFRSLGSYFSSGILMIFLAGLLLNSFLSGGIFSSVKDINSGFSSGEFFRNSAKYMGSFLLISLIISIIVFILALLIFIIPVTIVSKAEVVPEGSVFKTAIIAGSIFLLMLVFLLLVTDYARAWQVRQERYACFRALGFGLRQTIRNFFDSYFLMLTLLIIQILWGWFVLKIIAGFSPVTEGGILLLFLVSQSLFLIKIFLKVFRYASVTSMTEN